VCYLAFGEERWLGRRARGEEIRIMGQLEQCTINGPGNDLDIALLWRKPAVLTEINCCEIPALFLDQTVPHNDTNVPVHWKSSRIGVVTCQLGYGEVCHGSSGVAHAGMHLDGVRRRAYWHLKSSIAPENRPALMRHRHYRRNSCRAFLL